MQEEQRDRPSIEITVLKSPPPLPRTRALGASVAVLLLLLLLERRPREALLLLIVHLLLLLLLLLRVIAVLWARLPLPLRPWEKGPRLLLLLLETWLLLLETWLLLPGEHRRGDVRRHRPLLVAMLLLLLLLRAVLRARAPLLLMHHRHLCPPASGAHAGPAAAARASAAVPERRHGLPQIRQRRRRGPPVEQSPREPGDGPRRGVGVAEAQQRGPLGAARGLVGVKVR